MKRRFFVPLALLAALASAKDLTPAPHPKAALLGMEQK